MKLDWNNPEQLTAISLIVSFVGFMIFIYLWKPSWVCNEKYKISKKLLVSFSLTFSLIVSIIVLLIYSKRENKSHYGFI
jgi:uncharacterized membrane protein YeaQ/YmgE (transglycosylase-associated protein family)